MKRIGIILLASLLLMLSIPFGAYATESASVSVGSVNGCPGETVTVNVVLQNNPGMVALRLYISYDTASLRLLNVTDKRLFGAGNAVFGNDKTEVPYTVYWADALSTNNHTESGTLCAMTFLILDSATEGNSEIALSVDSESTFDVDLENVPVNVENGFVNIQNGSIIGSDRAKVYIESIQAAPMETIEVPVYLTGNPGIIAIKLSVSYDNRALKLKGVRNGTVFDESLSHFGNDLTLQPFTLYWEDALSTQDNVNDGVLAILEFEVLRLAPEGETEIHLEYEPSSTFNMDLYDVLFQMDSGSVLIRGTSPGDADEDEDVTLQDVVVITRWLAGGWNVTINESNADVNADGIVDLKDAVLIRRFLAGGWNVVLK